MECFSPVPFLVVLVGTLCILPVYLGALLGISLLIQLFLLIKKKKVLVDSLCVCYLKLCFRKVGFVSFFFSLFQEIDKFY